jgi:hypothetical protein
MEQMPEVREARQHLEYSVVIISPRSIEVFPDTPETHEINTGATHGAHWVFIQLEGRGFEFREGTVLKTDGRIVEATLLMCREPADD